MLKTCAAEEHIITIKGTKPALRKTKWSMLKGGNVIPKNMINVTEGDRIIFNIECENSGSYFVAKDGRTLQKTGELFFHNIHDTDDYLKDGEEYNIIGFRLMKKGGKTLVGSQKPPRNKWDLPIQLRVKAKPLRKSLQSTCNNDATNSRRTTCSESRTLRRSEVEEQPLLTRHSFSSDTSESVKTRSRSSISPGDEVVDGEEPHRQENICSICVEDDKDAFKLPCEDSHRRHSISKQVFFLHTCKKCLVENLLAKSKTTCHICGQKISRAQLDKLLPDCHICKKTILPDIGDRITLPCSHRFHAPCIRNHFKLGNKHCSVCYVNNWEKLKQLPSGEVRRCQTQSCRKKFGRKRWKHTCKECKRVVCSDCTPVDKWNSCLLWKKFTTMKRRGCKECKPPGSRHGLKYKS